MIVQPRVGIDLLYDEEPFKCRMANAGTMPCSVAGVGTLMGHVAVSAHRLLTRRRQRSDATETKLEDQPEPVD